MSKAMSFRTLFEGLSYTKENLVALHTDVCGCADELQALPTRILLLNPHHDFFEGLELEIIAENERTCVRRQTSVVATPPILVRRLSN